MVDALPEPQRSVVVAVFRAPQSSGWMLYFSKFQRQPLIHKLYQPNAAIGELAESALKHLAYELKHDPEPYSVRVVRGRDGSLIEGLHPPLMKQFVLRHKPIIGEDPELFQYLFSKAPRKTVARRKKVLEPLPATGNEIIPVTADTVIAAADASFKRAGATEESDTAGTGWVIERKNPAGVIVLESGSRHYASPEEGHTFSSNTFEMYAMRDALAHMRCLDEIHAGEVSRIVLYSDSTFVVRALLERDMLRPVVNTVEEIHDLIAGFALDGIKVDCMWTKGHADNRWNRMADRMASIGRENPFG